MAAKKGGWDEAVKHLRHAIAGEVHVQLEAVGPGTTRFDVGDRVVAAMRGDLGGVVTAHAEAQPAHCRA